MIFYFILALAVLVTFAIIDLKMIDRATAENEKEIERLVTLNQNIFNGRAIRK